jgi:hypothetical protein
MVTQPSSPHDAIPLLSRQRWACPVSDLGGIARKHCVHPLSNASALPRPLSNVCIVWGRPRLVYWRWLWSFRGGLSACDVLQKLRMGHRVAGLVYSCTCSEPERLRLEGSQAGSHAKACTYVLLGSKGGKKNKRKRCWLGRWAMRARVTRCRWRRCAWSILPIVNCVVVAAANPRLITFQSWLAIGWFVLRGGPYH